MKLFLFKIVQISGWFTFQYLLLSHKKINFGSFSYINVHHGYNKSLQLRCNSPYKTLHRNFGIVKNNRETKMLKLMFEYEHKFLVRESRYDVFKTK